jgi:serine kinase of HPr protein (carbohydrate metabolism regulator)
MIHVRGTCIAIDGRGLLLQGDSGSGKSDLALRLIEDGARLVADDYTDVSARDGALLASAPEAIRGLLEVRGLGIVRLDWLAAAPIVAAIELVPAAEVPRMPEADTLLLLGIGLPRFRLAAFEASAPAKVRLALRLVTGGIMRVE